MSESQENHDQSNGNGQNGHTKVEIVKKPDGKTEVIEVSKDCTKSETYEKTFPDDETPSKN